MRYTAKLMATIGKAATQPLGRPPSANAVKGLKAQNRGLQSNSSPVYKTQSETSILPRQTNVVDKNINRARRLSTGAGMKPVKTLDDVSDLLRNGVAKNVVVVAGAGISTPSGIPDFRTPGTGLYDNLQQYRIPYPEAIFDIDYFHHNPKPFFTLAKELYPSGKYRPNYIQYFVRKLYDKGMLLRMYTQNIDGLERLAGIPPEKLVEAHGTFASATCTICGGRKDGSEIKDSIFKDRLPKCLKRGCPGIVKPDIVFFGEDLPQRFYLYLRDMLQTDLVIVMGTSLEVQPFAGIIDTVKYGVPRVLFNWNAVGPFRSGKRSQDVVATGDLITSTQKFADMIGWKTEMEELIIQNEGSFLVCSPQYTKQAANKPKPKPNRPEPITNAFWRNRMESSSEESSESETESSDESSSEDDTRRYKSDSFRRRGVRSTGSMKNNMGTATIKNGVGSNRLLNDIKKNGTNNSNGQKRDFSTRVPPGTRSPAPNSVVRSDKYLSGRNSVGPARPPSGKLANGRNSAGKTVPSADKTKAPSEKLAPLSNRTKILPDKVTGPSNKDKVQNTTVTPTDTSNKSEGKALSPQEKNNLISTEKNSISTEKNTISTEKDSISTEKDSISMDKVIKTEIKDSSDNTIVSGMTAASLTDTKIPSLEREITTKRENKVLSKTEKSELKETTNSSNDSKMVDNTCTTVLDDVKQGIDKLTLSDLSILKNDENSVPAAVNGAPKNLKHNLPTDVILSTRSEPALLSHVKRLSPVVAGGNKAKVPAIKSDTAVSSISYVNKNSKENSSDCSQKNGKIKTVEKFKRSKSEKNFRKKDKSEKKRSVSAKAKVNLRLLHNRYAKSVKSNNSASSEKSQQEDSAKKNSSAFVTSNEIDDSKQQTIQSDFQGQSYVNLIGTLQREKPLDIHQNMSDLEEKAKEFENFGNDLQTDRTNDCDNTNEAASNATDISEQLQSLSLNQTLPDEDEVCSDSDKLQDLRRKKFQRKPPKNRKKVKNQELNTLNPVPYGYATPRIKRLTNRAMIPANICNGYELPSEYVSPELLKKLASPNHVKLAYRHSIKSSSPVGVRLLVRESSNNSEIAEKVVDICQ